MDGNHHQGVSAGLPQIMVTAPDMGNVKSASPQCPEHFPASDPGQAGHATCTSMDTNSVSPLQEGTDNPSFAAASK